MKLIKQIHTWNSINYRQNTMITDFTLMDNIAVNHSINRYILDEAKVALVTGNAFGSPECVRISYAASMEELREAMSRIKEALSKLA